MRQQTTQVDWIAVTVINVICHLSIAVDNTKSTSNYFGQCHPLHTPAIADIALREILLMILLQLSSAVFHRCSSNNHIAPILWSFLRRNAFIASLTAYLQELCVLVEKVRDRPQLRIKLRSAPRLQQGLRTLWREGANLTPNILATFFGLRIPFRHQSDSICRVSQSKGPHYWVACCLPYAFGRQLKLAFTDKDEHHPRPRRSVFALFLSVFLHKRLFDTIPSRIQISSTAFIANAFGLDLPMSLLINVHVSAA